MTFLHPARRGWLGLLFPPLAETRTDQHESIHFVLFEGEWVCVYMIWAAGQGGGGGGGGLVVSGQDMQTRTKPMRSRGVCAVRSLSTFPRRLSQSPI